MSDADNPITENFNNSPAQSETPHEVAFLRSRFSEEVRSYDVFRGDLVIKLDSAVIVDALKALRDECDPSYNYLSYVTAEHWIERDLPVFEIHYGLQALPKPGTRLRLVVEVPDTPHVTVPSVTGVHPGANWHEREVYDLFGILFADHPNLTRILTPETYPEHPLRRDFPHAGEALTEFQDRLIAQWNVSEERDYRAKFGDKWIEKLQESIAGRTSLMRLVEGIAPGREMESPGDVAYRETHDKERDSTEGEHGS